MALPVLSTKSRQDVQAAALPYCILVHRRVSSLWELTREAQMLPDSSRQL